MESWEAVTALDEYRDLNIVKAPVPVYEQEAYDIGFQRCKENLCGCYDTNWGCNPGAKMDVEEYYKDKDFVIIARKTFEVDYNDEEALDAISDEMQRKLRSLVLKLREAGIACDGFLDGPCTYCGECAYPEPCRFPDMLTPSVSTLGIDLTSYFRSFGDSFAFEEGKVTLYGFIFVKKCA